MKYELISLPAGSVERAKAQLQQGDLIKAIKTCRQGNIELCCLQAELDVCLETLYRKKCCGLILSAYHHAGAFGKYTVDELLICISNAGDYPAFLKQAYRFDKLDGFEARIENAINWHIERERLDGVAWQRKFAKLSEQIQLRVSNNLAELLVEDEEVVNQPSIPPIKYKLKPVVGVTSKAKPLKPLPKGDPYIISQTARV